MTDQPANPFAPPPKRKRGRPRKVPIPAPEPTTTPEPPTNGALGFDDGLKYMLARHLTLFAGVPNLLEAIFCEITAAEKGAIPPEYVRKPGTTGMVAWRELYEQVKTRVGIRGTGYPPSTAGVLGLGRKAFTHRNTEWTFKE